MTEDEAIRRANELNMREEGTARYWACCVLYNWVIYRAPGGLRELAMLHIVGQHEHNPT